MNELLCVICLHLDGRPGQPPLFHPEHRARTVYAGFALCFRHFREVSQAWAAGNIAEFVGYAPAGLPFDDDQEDT